LSDYTAYDQLAIGFNEMVTHTVWFDALSKRTDAGKLLLKIYQATQPNALGKSWTLVQQGYYAFNIQTLEMLLSQEAMLKQLSGQERQMLVKEGFKKAKIMQTLPEIYGASNRIAQLYLMVSAMKMDNYTPFIKINDSKEWVNYNINLKNPIIAKQILDIANSYVGGGLELLAPVPCNDIVGTPVLTPNRSSVATWQRCELPATEIARIKADTRRNYPNATMVGDPTAKYNCHSYAWHSSATNNDKWIDNPSNYWEDCSYSPQNAWVGDKICYKSNADGSPIHSATLLNASTQRLRSKWGPWGLMEHKFNDCPQNYWNTTLSFYKLTTVCPVITGLSTTNITGTTALLKWSGTPCMGAQIEGRVKDKVWTKWSTFSAPNYGVQPYNAIALSRLSRNTCYEWRIT
jgi:hypothetical protein